MKIAMNPHIIGKPILVTDQQERKWLMCKGKNVNLGKDWMNIDMPFDDIFELITVDGYASSAELEGDHRSDAEFKSRQLFMVDIDKEMTINELLEDDFYNACGAGFYTTPSHTMDSHRFRILFVTEQPITDREDARNLTMGLMKMYKHSDISCKDTTRIFYGSPNCILKEKKCETLPNQAVQELINLVRSHGEENEHISNQKKVGSFVQSQNNYTEFSKESKEKIIKLLHESYVGEYPIWRNIGWAMKTAGFELDDFQYVTEGMMRKKSSKDARDIWNASNSNQLSMGTIIHFLRGRYGTEKLSDLYAPNHPISAQNDAENDKNEHQNDTIILTGTDALKRMRQDTFKLRRTIRGY